MHWWAVLERFGSCFREGILCSQKSGAAQNSWFSLGQGGQWGFCPTKRGSVWGVSFGTEIFVLVLYIGTLYLVWVCSRRGEVRRFFITKVLIHDSFHCVDSCFCFHRDQKLHLPLRRWKQSGCKTFCTCQPWSVEYSQQPPAGNEPKAVMQRRLRCSSTGKGKTPTSQDSDQAKWDWEVQQQPGCQHIPAWDLGCHLRPTSYFGLLCPARVVLHFQHVL